ncbi:MAG: peptidoglycan-binding domain-containing protein, partial [bacterium]
YYRVEGSLLSETMPEFDWDDNAIYEIIPGETSYGVARMQQRLGILGYLVGSRADGAFGEATSNALRLFQVTVGLPATGAGDIPTLERLFAADAPVNPKPIATPTPTPDPDIPLLPEEGPLKPSEDFEAR